MYVRRGGEDKHYGRMPQNTGGTQEARTCFRRKHFGLLTVKFLWRERKGKAKKASARFLSKYGARPGGGCALRCLHAGLWNKEF